MSEIKAFDDSTISPRTGLVGDHRSLDKLRQLGLGDKKQQALALKTAAEQFENLFMEHWYNAMRQTNDTINPDSPLHSKYSSMFEDMLTQQHIAAGNGKGKLNKSSITYMIAKQFANSLGDQGKELLKELEQGGDSTVPGVISSYGAKNITPYKDPRVNAQQALSVLRKAYDELPSQESMRSYEGPEDFVKKMMPYAIRAVENAGFNPLVLVAQAALETGWGNHVPSGNNYYGIKTNSSWRGDSEALNSPEFRNGRYVTEVSKFRKYSDVLESMKDYISFIKENQRYAEAVDKSFDTDAYFEEIQRAGYATDPHYAEKLKNISRQIAFMAYK
ncbi:MAG: glucosaminidase domain-containing protein [Succinivibrio sp.]|nr:glucosaminidase domain-containing protein [Succinivibrio sp.]